MPSRLPAVVQVVLALVLVLAANGPAWAQKVALLIGNANYATAPLTNPPNDVRVMEAALKKVGFKVQTVLNANQNQMKRALRDFGDNAQGAEVAFLYYSGHGTQAGGENYLIPLQANINKESDYEIEAVGANGLMRQIAGARPKAAIVVLDACRDNPLASATKSTSKGLGRMDAPTGSMIAFATAPNTTASDEGFYARELARQITVPGQELYDVFRNTTAQVQRISQGKQVPRLSEVSITEKIYLAGGPPTPGPATQLASVMPEPTTPQRPTQAVHSPAGQATSTAQVFKDCADCPEMVVVPSGNFQMGSNDAGTQEKPVHSVSIQRFAIGKYEVTQGQWTALMGNYPSSNSNCGDSCPAEMVNWNDVQQYIRKLNKKTGQTYRLPSESEWEYACRAGASQTYCGSNEVDTVAVHEKGSGGKTQWVGSKPPNAWGLHDMSGNVWEWTQDCWNESYTGAPGDGSAWTIGNCDQRVLRGGSKSDAATYTRAANRAGFPIAFRKEYFGFRLARVTP